MICAFDATGELQFKPTYNNELDKIENCYINETKTDIENVTISAGTTGMWIYAPVGTVKNCTISGTESGIKLHVANAGNNPAITLQDCDVTGGTQALLITDEGRTGTIKITSDSSTTFTSENGQAIVKNIASNSTTVESSIAGFAQDEEGAFVKCTNHTYAEASRVEPTSTTVPVRRACSAAKVIRWLQQDSSIVGTALPVQFPVI